MSHDGGKELAARGKFKVYSGVEGAQLRMAEGEVRIASQLSGLTGKEGAEGEADSTEQPSEGTGPGSQINKWIYQGG